MTEQEIAGIWNDYSIDEVRGTVTFRAVSNANFKDFFTAPINDDAAIREAAKDAQDFQSSEWEKNAVEDWDDEDGE
jgi:hypothetical protein